MSPSPFLFSKCQVSRHVYNKSFSEKKQKKSGDRGRYFFILNFMTRFFGNSAALYIRNRLYIYYIYTHRTKDLLSIKRRYEHNSLSTSRVLLFLLPISVFSTSRAPPLSRKRLEEKKTDWIFLSFVSRRFWSVSHFNPLFPIVTQRVRDGRFKEEWEDLTAKLRF